MTDDPNKIPERFRQQTRTSESVIASPEAVRRAAEQLRQQATRPAPTPMYIPPPAPTAPPRSSPSPYIFPQNDPAAAIAEEQARADKKFMDAADRCKSDTYIDMIPKGGSTIDIRGTRDQMWKFDKCMSERGQPTFQRRD